MAGPIQVAGIPGTKAALISLCEAGQWAQASNLVSDARRAAGDAVKLSAVLDAVWAERGPTGDARGWPVVLDTPTPVNVPQRAAHQAAELAAALHDEWRVRGQESGVATALDTPRPVTIWEGIS